MGQFPAGLDIERVSGIQRRVEDVGRVCAFAQRKLDGVLFVRFSSTVVAFVKFERDVRLQDVSFRKSVGGGEERVPRSPAQGSSCS
jgi:hypothetical protein